MNVSELENAGKLLGGDGYDRMEMRRHAGFVPISGWGRDGWDLGDWPLVVVSARSCGEVYEVLVDVEGDLTLTQHPAEGLQARIDEIAVFYWRLDPASHGMTDLPPIGPVPEKYTGPYRSA